MLDAWNMHFEWSWRRGKTVKILRQAPARRLPKLPLSRSGKEGVPVDSGAMNRIAMYDNSVTFYFPKSLRLADDAEASVAILRESFQLNI